VLRYGACDVAAAGILQAALMWIGGRGGRKLPVERRGGRLFVVPLRTPGRWRRPNDTCQTAVKTHNHILSVVQAHKHMPGETYKIYGDNSHKFSLDHFNNNEVFLQFNHKVTKSRVFKLILLIADESKLENLTLLPVEVRVYA